MDFLFIEQNYVQKAYEDLKFRSSSSSAAEIEEDPNKKNKLPCVINFLKTIPSNSLILDIGCGENLCTRFDCFTVGLDCCVPSAARKQRAKNGDFIQAELLHLPFRENAFNCILLVSVLHHIPLEQRRLECLQNCLSLMTPQPSSKMLVVVWAKEQQSAKLPANDVIVPYNLEDLSHEGHISEILFNKYSTKQQRIIMNSIPISIANPFLRNCCQQYLPKRIQKQFLQMAARLFSIYPNFISSSIDFYEEHFQNALQFVIERIGEIKSIQQNGRANPQNQKDTKMDILKEFAFKLSRTMFVDAFTQLRVLHREVLKYRYYHVFQKGELEYSLQQIGAFHNKFSIQKCDYEYGNWYICLHGIDQ